LAVCGRCGVNTRLSLILCEKQVLVPSIVTISFIDCLKSLRLLVVFVALRNFCKWINRIWKAQEPTLFAYCRIFESGWMKIWSSILEREAPHSNSTNIKRQYK
jgi:hypothetical protein